ncbi:unnamed protein product [Coregonus sp. 'balchen']|nr:unnamed protein product [Coregonus sp. 'balchen']
MMMLLLMMIMLMMMIPSCVCLKGTHTQSSVPGVPSSQKCLINCKQILLSKYQDQEDDDTLTSVHYAALNVIHKKPKTHRQRSAMERDTAYSGVRCQNMD